MPAWPHVLGYNAPGAAEAGMVAAYPLLRFSYVPFLTKKLSKWSTIPQVGVVGGRRGGGGAQCWAQQVVHHPPGEGLGWGLCRGRRARARWCEGWVWGGGQVDLGCRKRLMPAPSTASAG